jgi:MoxR-like ATPase
VTVGHASTDLEVTFQRRIRIRIAQLLVEMTAGLVERDVPVRLALLAAIAGEHVLLVGPPGTAKSEIARRLRLAFRDARFFERLMTRFSVPEELFGPLSLQALERDEYRRLTEGYLPTAEIAFLDEVFKANSAILNSLLTIMNEREFDNGRERVALPLISLIGASNEIPTAEELVALYDRFLVRYRVDAVSSSGFARLLRLEADGAEVQSHLSPKLIAKIRGESARVRISSGVRHLLHTLREWLQSKGMYVSDRRWLKIRQLLRVAAYTEGRMIVLWPDCWLVLHCVWSRPEQYGLVREWFDTQLLELVREEPRRYARLVASIGALAASPTVHKVHKKDALGRPLYMDDDGTLVTRKVGRRLIDNASGEALYARPGTPSHADPATGLTAQELFEEFGNDLDAYDEYLSDPAHRIYMPIALPAVLEVPPGQAAQNREVQLTELAADLAAFLAAVSEQAQSIVIAPLWLPADVARAIGTAMAESSEELAQTLVRLQQSQAAFASDR